jgi:hypothetical protein
VASPERSGIEERAISLDRRVVRALADGRGRLAFNGLRRALEAHPESLTRSLRRLERFGTVGHDAGGYFLVDGPAPPLVPGPAPQYARLASVRLPGSFAPEVVVGLLAGRWFGPFRWVGLQEGARGPSLVWSAPGLAGHLLVRPHGGQLRVEAELPKGRAVDAELERAGDELLWHVLSRVRASFPEATPPGNPYSAALTFARSRTDPFVGLAG